MISTNINQPVITQKIFAAGIKAFALLKLSLKSGMYKNTDNKDWLVYLLNTPRKDATVIDIGHHRREYLFDVMKLAAHTKTMITFEYGSSVYNYLVRMKQFLRLNNLIVEKASANKETERAVELAEPAKKNSTRGVQVIDLKERIKRKQSTLVLAGLFDQYFLAKEIRPDVMKIRTEGKELEILQSSVETLRMYKPVILLECRTSDTQRESLTATFNYLINLNYAGYFMLDTLKIPLANFDFNIYQNPAYGFYSNTFLFE